MPLRVSVVRLHGKGGPWGRKGYSFEAMRYTWASTGYAFGAKGYYGAFQEYPFAFQE